MAEVGRRDRFDNRAKKSGTAVCDRDAGEPQAAKLYVESTLDQLQHSFVSSHTSSRATR
jgi:hypothetical protein